MTVDVRARFLEDVADHEMTVLHDDGEYRHVQFKEPGTRMYWFDLIGTPGLLTVHGDMGTYVFSRERDMFGWFHNDRDSIDHRYWAQKLQADSGVREYTEASFIQWVKETVEEKLEYIDESKHDEIREQVADDILTQSYSEDLARTALDEFRADGVEFTDTWEADFTEFTFHFLWNCEAIRWGLNKYYGSKNA